MKPEDKITVAVVGAISAGKKILQEKAEQHPEILLEALLGNFWVPHHLTSLREEVNEPLLTNYSINPSRYAFPFQTDRLAGRLKQQRQVESTPGLVISGEPLEVDRWIYAEANRDLIGEFFPIYQKHYHEVEQRARPIDVLIYLRIKPEDVQVLQERIKKEGKPEEQKFVSDPTYLLRLIELHEQRFHGEQHRPIIEINATHPVFGRAWDEQYFQETLRHIAARIREYKQPPRYTLDEWEAIDHNLAQKGFWEARRQLKQYLRERQRIITIAGNVSAGKTGLAEMLSNELEIAVMRELDGKRNDIIDENPLLRRFLDDKERYCYDLQENLIPERTGKRRDFYHRNGSFVEDRSPVEDQSIFWRRFEEQGYLTPEQMKKLKDLAREAYARAPKSNLFLQLDRDPRQCRKMILIRGRPEEITAWPLSELQAMDKFYQTLFEDMEQYGSHDGPKLKLDMAEVDPSKAVHQGYIFQEMLHNFLEHDHSKK